MSLSRNTSSSITFESLETLEDLAEALGHNLDWLKRFEDDAFQRGQYTSRLLPKRGRGSRGRYRTVYLVDDDLRRVQKEILQSLNQRVAFPECIQGFVKNGSTYKNAVPHCGHPKLLVCDIEDFFDNISTTSVLGVFSGLGAFHDPASTVLDPATLLMRLCTLAGGLPQGACTSPMLSNLACEGLDRDLIALAGRVNAAYTRYSDDIAFSGDEVPTVKQVSTVLHKYRFRLRGGKTIVRVRGQAQYVTGLSVANAEPRLPARFKRYLQLEIHYATKKGVAAQAEYRKVHKKVWRSRVHGLLCYALSIEREFAAALLDELEQAPP
jgi:hypothetical protein